MITTMASDRKDIRLLLVGLTGSGKSSTGNTLVGTDYFKEGLGSKSETFKCKQGTMEWYGSKVQVMDSPGLFDTKKSHEEIADQVVQALFELRPGPHAFLYVVNVSQRYTEEQFNAYKRLKMYFGNQIPKFTIVVFTHGDSIKAKGMTLKQYIGKGHLSDDLESVVNECGRRCILFDNTSKDKELQVESLMAMVDTLVKGNRNQHYKDTFPHDNVSGALKERVKKAEEEELKKKQHVMDLKRKRQEAEWKRQQEEKARLRAEEAAVEAEWRRREEQARFNAQTAAAEAEWKRQQEDIARFRAQTAAAEAEQKRQQEENARFRAQQAAAEAERKRQQEENARFRAQQAAAEAERKRQQEENARFRAQQAAAEAERKRQQEENARFRAQQAAAEAERKRQQEEADRRKEKALLQQKIRDAPGKLKEAERMEAEAKSLRTKAIVQYVFAVPTLGLSTIDASDREERADALEAEARKIRKEYA